MNIPVFSRPKPSLPATPKVWPKAVWFCAAYFVCAELGSQLSIAGGTSVSFWLPAGLYVSVLLLSPTRDWSWLAAAALPANLAFDLFHGTRLLLIPGFYLANTLQALLGAWLVRRFVAERPTLATLKEFFGVLLFAGILSTFSGALLGAGLLTASGLSRSFAHSLQVWWGSCTLAVLVVAPFILCWALPPERTRSGFRPPRRVVEATLLFGGLIFYCWQLLVQGGGLPSPQKTPLLLFLLWAGLRLGVRGAAAANLVLALLASLFTTHYLRGFTPADIAAGLPVSLLQGVLPVAAVVGLIPAIVLAERDRTMRRLQESEEHYRHLTEAAFEGISISEHGRIVDVNDQCLKMFGYQRQEMLGMEVIQKVAPESRAVLAAAIRTGQETTYEHRLVRKDGSLFYAEARARNVSVGNRTYRMTAFRDITQRKEIEEILRQSEERFRNFTAAAFEGICISEHGRILDANPQFALLFGYAREALLGREILMLISPASRAVIAERLRTGDGGMVEHRLLRQDGTTFEGEAQARVILWGTREVRVTAVRDITGRKRAEQLTAMEMKVLEMIARGQPLTETLNTLLRLVESQSPELLCSVLLLSPDGTQLRHAAAPSLPADFLRHIDDVVIGPQSGSCGTAAFRCEPVLVADIAADPLWTDYKQFALAHGLRACWSTPIFDAQRHVLGTFAIYHRLPGLPHERDLRLIDMATHTAAICISNHRAEEALRESEEKFSKAFRSNPNGICITEMATGRYLELNESFCRVFGYTQPEMIGRTALEVGVWESLADRERLLGPVRRHGSVRDLQLQTRDRAGRVKILMVSAELIELRGRECLVCMLHDITSRVQAEQERSEAEQREAQARAEYTLQLIAYQEAERKRIAGELHDSLGQNLLLIKNRARLALTKASQPAEMRDQLDHISELVTACLAEVRQISRDLHPYQLEHLGLTRSLETLVDNIAQASALKCQRKFEPVDDLFTGEAATSLYRIVQESLNNILKHSQAGHVKLGLERDIHEVTLSIEDDGCGFQTGRAGKGLGLKNIGERVRMLGGRCQIVSQPGQGTRIAVIIPIPAELP